MKQKIIRFLSSMFIMCLGIFITGCTLPEGGGQGQSNVLSNPTDFSVTSGETVIATWSKVEGASHYIIYLYKDGACIESLVGESGMEITSLENGSYEAAIKTMGDGTNYLSSKISEKVPFVVDATNGGELETLPTPSRITLQYDKDLKRVKVTFKDEAAYTKANGFMAYIYANKTLVRSVTLEYNGASLDVSSLKEGTYVVELKALGDCVLTGNSAVSSSNVSFVIEKENNGGGSELTGYYQNASGKTGDALESALRQIITSTHRKILNYDDLRSALQKTDRDPSNPNNLILFYCRDSVRATWDSGNTWNREHVWPNSKGVGKTGPGADAHHLRPTDPQVNSTRGSHKVDKVTGGTEIMYKGRGTGCYYGGGKFEPADSIKGDVARIYFYLLTRYDFLYSYISGAANLNTLLEWNEFDPVDASEIYRNEQVYLIQGNRNPFIDHPEFANSIW